MLYQEKHVLDLSGTSGVFAIGINDGTAAVVNTEPFTLDRAFQNRGSFTFGGGKCAVGSTYAPNPADGRRLSVMFNDGTFSGWEPLPDQQIAFVPMALETMTVGGYNAPSLLRVVDGTGQPATTTPLSLAQYNNLLDLSNGTSTAYRSSVSPVAGGDVSGNITGLAAGFTGSLAGDVTGTQGATSVVKIQGRAVGTTAPTNGQVLAWNGSTNQWEASNTAVTGVTSVATGTGLTGGPITSTGTISLATVGSGGTGTKITYDAYGRVTASTTLAESDLPNITSPGKVSGDAITSGTIAGSTALNTTGNVTAANVSGINGAFKTIEVWKSDNSNKVTIAAPNSLSSNYGLTLPLGPGAAGQVLQTDGTGVLSWVTPSAGTITAVTGSAPVVVSGTSSLTVSVNNASTSGTGVVQLATDGQNAANVVVQGNDSRLSNSRAPSGAAGGDLAGNYPNPTIGAGAVTTPKLFANPGINRIVATDSTTGATLAALTCSANQLLTLSVASGWQCTNQSALTVGSASSATSFTGSLAGDVTGTQSATVVSTVGGSTAADVHTAEIAANAATNTNLGSTIVKRDASGKFSAGGASLASLVLRDTGSNTVTFQAPTTVTTSYVLKWPAALGSAGQVLSTDASGNLSWVSAAGGSVTSITAGTGLTGGTITSSGTIAVDAGTTANKIVQLDASAKLPAVDGSQLTNLNPANLSGAVSTAKGGTGLSSIGTANQVLGVNAGATGLEYKTLTAGSGVSISNSAGAVTITATGSGGTVTNVTGTAPISVATGTSTPVVSISQANGTTSGYLSSADWTTFNGKLGTSSTFTGDVSGTSSTMSVDKIKGSPIALTAPASGNFLRYNGTNWVNTNLAASDLPSGGYDTTYFKNGGNSFGGAAILGTNDANDLVLRTNGAQRMFISSTGNIGIGTTSAFTTLQVGGTIAATGAVNASPTSGAGAAKMFATASHAYFASNTTSLGVRIRSNDLTSDAEGITVLTGGNVGIGTLTPAYALDVVGNVRGTQLCIGTDCRAAWPSGSGGTVTSVTSANSDISVATGTTTPVLTLNSGTAANQIVKLDASAKLPAVDGSALTNLNATALASGTIAAARMPALTGDVTMTAGTTATTVAKIQTTPVTITTLTNGNFLKYNGTAWVNVTPSSADLSDAGSLIKSSQMPANCGAGQTLTFSSPTGTWSCTSISVTGGNFGSQAANTIFAAPNGSAGTPSFRALAAADLPAGTVSGTGTTGYVPYFSGASTLANSPLVVSGGNIGLGTTTPTANASGTILHIHNALTDAAPAASAVHFTNGTTGAGANNGFVIGRWSGGSQSYPILWNYENSPIVMATNTVERLRIDSSGNIGINTASPGALLDIYGTNATSLLHDANGGVKFATASGSNYIESAGSGMTGAADLNFTDMNNNNQWMTIKASGAVGIGTTSPTQKLTVVGNNSWGTIDSKVFGTSYFPGFIGEYARGTASVASAVQANDKLASFGGNGFDGATYIAGSSINADVDGAVSANVLPTRLSFWTNNGAASASEKMRITSAGNVGIGTTAPGAQLEVNGNMNVGSDSANAATQTATYGNYLNFLGASNNSDPLWMARYNVSNDVSELRMNIGDNTSGSYADRFVVGTTAGAVWNPYFTVNSLGSVGIGTTNPAYSLDVNGIARATQLCIGTDCRSAWPAGGTITGSGTTGAVPVFTGATSVGNSPISVSGANTGFGSGAPTAKVEVLTTGQAALSVGDGSVDSSSTYGTVNITRPADTTRAHLALIRAGNYVWQLGYQNGTNTLGFYPWNFSGSQGTATLSMSGTAVSIPGALTVGSISGNGAGLTGVTAANATNANYATTSGTSSFTNTVKSFNSANNMQFGYTGSAWGFWVDSTLVKTFVINHPTDPERYLVHGTLEGPEGAVFYRGEATLEEGEAEVKLPSYFEALTRKEGRTVLLTAIDGFDPLAVQSVEGQAVKDGHFRVISNNTHSRQKFHWEVKAVRADVAPLDVEPLKKDMNVHGVGPYTYATRAPAGQQGTKVQVEQVIEEKDREISELKAVVCELKPDAKICRKP